MPPIQRSIRFLQKAEAALIAAIEIYNKPDFRYREESFSILGVNAWELLLKAKLLAENGNDPKCLWVYERRQSKKGQPTKKYFKKRNRAGNVQTLGLGQAIVALEKKGIRIPPGVKRNLDALVEIRDNAVHYLSAGPLLTKQVLEIGTASIQNYLKLSKEWFQQDLSNYNLNLMPIGFVRPPRDVEAIVVSRDEHNLVKYLTEIMKASDIDSADPFQVALTIQLRLKKSPSDAAIKVAVTDDPEATKVFLTEDDIRKAYPWDYTELTMRLRSRYTDFKLTDTYHNIRKALLRNPAYCRSRFLDPGNPKSPKKDFYNPNIMNEFDKHYTKKGAS